MEKAFSIRESIKSAWKLINNDNLFLLIGLILGYLVIYGLISTVQVLNKGGISGMISQLVGLFVSVVFTLGFIKVCLQIAKEEEPEFKAFKDMIPKFFTYLFASIISALPAIGAAIIAFIIGLVTIIAGHVIAGFSVLDNFHLSAKRTRLRRGHLPNTIHSGFIVRWRFGFNKSFEERFKFHSGDYLRKNTITPTIAQ